MDRCRWDTGVPKGLSLPCSHHGHGERLACLSRSSCISWIYLPCLWSCILPSPCCQGTIGLGAGTVGAGLSPPEEQPSALGHFPVLPHSPGAPSGPWCWVLSPHSPSIAPDAPASPSPMPPPISSSSPPQSNKIEKAVSAAHTFLQKNPKHEMTLKYLNYYRTMVDVDEYLVDLEAQPYEVRRGRGWGGTGTPRGDGRSVRAWLAKPILLNPEASTPAEPWLAHLPAPQKKHLRGAGARDEAVSGGARQVQCLCHPAWGWAPCLALGEEVSGALSAPCSRFSCGR